MKIRLISVIFAFALALAAAPVFGATGHVHDGVTFDKELTNENLSDYLQYDSEALGYYLPEGNYYLGEDLNPTNTIRIYGIDEKAVNLCLNGHTINGAAVPTGGSDSGNAIRITNKNGNNGGILNLYDCDKTVENGCIANAPWDGIRVESGTLNAHGGTITGNENGVSVQGGCTVNVFGNTTITGNKSENLSLSLKIGTSFLFETINVDNGFTGNIGVTLRDTSGTRPNDHYGVFTTPNTVNLKDHFFSDLKDYTIGYNADKCLEVLEAAEVKIVNQKGTLLKSITGQYTGHKVTLPKKLKTGYDFKEYTYTESYSTKTVEKGGELVIPQKNTELTAELFIVLTKQPTADKPSVATEAEGVTYQWYEKEKKSTAVAFSTGGSGENYWANNSDTLSDGQVYHLTFPDGVPDGLEFNLGTATKTGTNTYDVTPVYFPPYRSYAISMSATEAINMTATTDAISETAISGETSATLSEQVKGKTYFCRVTDDEGIYTDSNAFVASDKKGGAGKTSDNEVLTGDNFNYPKIILLLCLAIAVGVIALIRRKE